MIHVENGEAGKLIKHNSKAFRGKSPPLNSKLKNKSDLGGITQPASIWRSHIEHTKERTRGVFYPKKNMKGVDEHFNNFRRDQHKFRKQQTAQQVVSSGGMTGVAFSGVNPSGASVGGQFGKWSGEIVGHRNISGLSSEEIGRASCRERVSSPV